MKNFSLEYAMLKSGSHAGRSGGEALAAFLLRRSALQLAPPALTPECKLIFAIL
jgi:hypothetical protein